MNISKIFIFQIGNSSIIRKLLIYEILKILRALYPIMKLLLLIFKIPLKLTFHIPTPFQLNKNLYEKFIIIYPSKYYQKQNILVTP